MWLGTLYIKKNNKYIKIICIPADDSKEAWDLIKDCVKLVEDNEFKIVVKEKGK